MVNWGKRFANCSTMTCCSYISTWGFDNGVELLLFLYFYLNLAVGYFDQSHGYFMVFQGFLGLVWM